MLNRIATDQIRALNVINSLGGQSVMRIAQSAIDAVRLTRAMNDTFVITARLSQAIQETYKFPRLLFHDAAVNLRSVEAQVASLCRYEDRIQLLARQLQIGSANGVANHVLVNASIIDRLAQQLQASMRLYETAMRAIDAAFHAWEVAKVQDDSLHSAIRSLEIARLHIGSNLRPNRFRCYRDYQHDVEVLEDSSDESDGDCESANRLIETVADQAEDLCNSRTGGDESVPQKRLSRLLIASFVVDLATLIVAVTQCSRNSDVEVSIHSRLLNSPVVSSTSPPVTEKLTESQTASVEDALADKVSYERAKEDGELGSN